VSQRLAGAACRGTRRTIGLREAEPGGSLVSPFAYVYLTGLRRARPDI
jgi:hypothetical protein